MMPLRSRAGRRRSAGYVCGSSSVDAACADVATNANASSGAATDVDTVVYTADKTLRVEARDSVEAVVTDATCTLTTVSTGVPTPDTADRDVTVRCSTVSIEGDAGVPGTLSLRPVAAQPLDPSVTITAEELDDAGLAGTLMNTTDDTTCGFLPPTLPRTGGDVVVRCSRDGVDAADVTVSLLVTATVGNATLALDGQTLVARVQQQSATSCAVQCGTENPSVLDNIAAARISARWTIQLPAQIAQAKSQQL
jgi:hypothetical protein